MNLKREVRDDRGIPKPRIRDRNGSSRSRLAGTNRDFDSDLASANQAHGHPREERLAAAERPDEAGRSNRKNNAGIRGGHSGQGHRRSR
jgi:hypothetical protein